MHTTVVTKGQIKGVLILNTPKLEINKLLFIHHSFKGPNSYNESETIAKYEIMDGAPVRGKWVKF